MSEEPQQEEMEEDEEDDEMDADFTPEMAEKLRGMITMGEQHLPTLHFTACVWPTLYFVTCMVMQMQGVWWLKHRADVRPALQTVLLPGCIVYVGVHVNNCCLHI